MKLGLVTYQMAAEWDIDTIIANCRESGFDGVELRTTHAHGVEESLTNEERDAVCKTFEDSGIVAYGVGTAFEYHSADPAEVRENVEGSKRYAALAADLGMEGIKVRPNGLPDGVPEEKTLEQIGQSVREVAEAGADAGIEIWLEVHGHETCRVDRMRKIIDIASHPNAYLTYNCNPGETDESGSCKASYELLRDRIGCVHIQELWDPERYPYAEFLQLLKAGGYSGWTSYEGPGSSDAVLVMKCYKQMWDLMLQGRDRTLRTSVSEAQA